MYSTYSPSMYEAKIALPLWKLNILPVHQIFISIFLLMYISLYTYESSEIMLNADSNLICMVKDPVFLTNY